MNDIYDHARVKLLTAAFNWPATDLVLAAFTIPPDFVPTDSVLGDITARYGGATTVYLSQPITEKTVSTNGTAQTNHVVIPDVAVGPTVKWFAMCKRGATPPDAELILYVDEAIELPFVPNGLDLVVSPDWLDNRGWWRP